VSSEEWSWLTVDVLNGFNVVSVQLAFRVVAVIPGVHERSSLVRMTDADRVTNLVRCHGQ